MCDQDLGISKETDRIIPCRRIQYMKQLDYTWNYDKIDIDQNISDMNK